MTLINWWWDEVRTKPPLARAGVGPAEFVRLLGNEHTINAIWDIDVLEELGLADHPTLLVLNKADRVSDRSDPRPAGADDTHHTTVAPVSFFVALGSCRIGGAGLSAPAWLPPPVVHDPGGVVTGGGR